MATETPGFNVVKGFFLIYFQQFLSNRGGVFFHGWASDSGVYWCVCDESDMECILAAFLFAPGVGGQAFSKT